jgi:hypothetical protein
VAWGGLLVQVLRHFDPGSSFTGWNSDVAITTLQSNDSVFDPFRLYYYGQDRIGAWPWLLAQGLRALTGFDWTPWRSFVWQATWACGACLALRGLQRQAGWLLAAAFAALALLLELFHVQLFALSQPFGWQLTALFLAWWALLRLLQSLEDVGSGRAAVVGWGAAATVFCTLACWTSPTSGPLLLLAIVAEGLRLWLACAGAPRRWKLLAALLPLAVGITFESVVRGIFHRFSRQQFGHGYGTTLKIDKGMLAVNAQMILLRIREQPVAPWVFLGLVAALVAGGYLLRRALRRSLDARAPETELAFLTLAFVGGALANAAITVLVVHVRYNEYSPRYLVPTFVLGTLAAASGAVLVLHLVPALRARAGILSALAALALFGVSQFLVPARSEDPALRRAQAAATAVLGRAGDTLLLGGYWDTYQLGALDPSHQLKSVPVQGDYMRTPFWVPRLRQAEHILAVSGEAQPLGPPERPNSWVLQYGVPFQLEQAHWADHPPFSFTRYRNAKALTAPVRLEPVPTVFPCEPGSTVTVRFEPRSSPALLLVSTNGPAGGTQARSAGAELRVEPLTNLWLVHLPASAAASGELTLRAGTEPREGECWYQDAALVLTPEASSATGDPGG